MAGALTAVTNTTPNYTLSNSNLTAKWTAANADQSVGSDLSILIKGNKYYWEVHIDATSGQGIKGGFYGSGFSFVKAVGQTADGVGYYSLGQILYNNGNILTIASAVQGDTICFALDLVNFTFWVRINGGNWNNSGTANPATNTGGASIATIAAAYSYFRPCVTTFYLNEQISINLGASVFAQTAPDGFTSPDSQQPTLSVINGTVGKGVSYSTKTRISAAVSSATIRANWAVGSAFGWSRQLPVTAPVIPTSIATSHAY